MADDQTGSGNVLCQELGRPRAEGKRPGPRPQPQRTVQPRREPSGTSTIQRNRAIEKRHSTRLGDGEERRSEPCAHTERPYAPDSRPAGLRSPNWRKSMTTPRRRSRRRENYKNLSRPGNSRNAIRNATASARIIRKLPAVPGFPGSGTAVNLQLGFHDSDRLIRHPAGTLADYVPDGSSPQVLDVLRSSPMSTITADHRHHAHTTAERRPDSLSVGVASSRFSFIHRLRVCYRA